MAAVNVVFAVFVIMSFIQGDFSIPVQLSEERGKFLNHSIDNFSSGRKNATKFVLIAFFINAADVSKRQCKPKHFEALTFILTNGPGC